MRLNKGEVLFRQGESGPLYRVDEGLLKVVRVYPDGGTFIFNILTPGEILPHHSLISPKEYHGTAVALTVCEITTIPAAAWYGELERDPVKYREAAILLQNKLRMMQGRIDQLTSVDPSEKLRQLIGWFAAYVPETELTELLTQEEIGQLLGLRRETVNRILRKLRNTGEHDAD